MTSWISSIPGTPIGAAVPCERSGNRCCISERGDSSVSGHECNGPITSSCYEEMPTCGGARRHIGRESRRAWSGLAPRRRRTFRGAPCGLAEGRRTIAIAAVAAPGPPRMRGVAARRQRMTPPVLSPAARSAPWSRRQGPVARVQPTRAAERGADLFAESGAGLQPDRARRPAGATRGGGGHRPHLAPRRRLHGARVHLRRRHGWQRWRAEGRPGRDVFGVPAAQAARETRAALAVPGSRKQSRISERRRQSRARKSCGPWSGLAARAGLPCGQTGAAIPRPRHPTGAVPVRAQR